MALWESITDSLGESLLPNLLVGAAVIVLAPVVIPAVLAGLRPVAKTAVKGGVLIFEKARETVTDVGEHISDLMAEARTELSAAATTGQGQPTSAPATSYE